MATVSGLTSLADHWHCLRLNKHRNGGKKPQMGLERDQCCAHCNRICQRYACGRWHAIIVQRPRGYRASATARADTNVDRDSVLEAHLAKTFQGFNYPLKLPFRKRYRHRRAGLQSAGSRSFSLFRTGSLVNELYKRGVCNMAKGEKEILPVYELHPPPWLPKTHTSADLGQTANRIHCAKLTRVVCRLYRVLSSSSGRRGRQPCAYCRSKWTHVATSGFGQW